jgi:hypothetical protein
MKTLWERDVMDVMDYSDKLPWGDFTIWPDALAPSPVMDETPVGEDS